MSSPADKPSDQPTDGARTVTEVPRYFSEIEPGRKGEILDAALEVFSEDGYDRGSMRQIAGKVGVSEPALYRHFSGKEALFVTLIRMGAGRFRDEVFVLIDAIEPPGIREQMLAVLANRRKAVRFYGPLIRTMVPAAMKNDRLLEEYRSAIIHPVRDKLTMKAAQLDAALGVPDADATRDGRVRALIALIVGYMVSSIALADEPDEVIVDAALRVMSWE